MDSEKLDEKTPIKAAEFAQAVDPIQTVEPVQSVEPIQNVQQSISQDFKQNKEIKNARIIILVLVTLELVFALYYLIQQCITLGRYDKIPSKARYGPVSDALIGDVVFPVFSVIYLIVFIVVVARYLRVGILVFAWLSIIQVVCTFAVFIISVIALADLENTNFGPVTNAGVAFSGVLVALSFLTFVFTIVVIIFAFKLAKLLKQQEAYQYV